MKPFFYRIDAGALIDFATDREGESITLLQFAKDLQKGKSDIAFIQSIIDEASNYIESKKEAGRRGGLAKASNALAKASSALAEPSSALANSSTPLAKASTPLASSSSSNNKEKEINKEKERIPFAEIIDEMNQLLGTKFRVVDSNTRFIKARWQDGYRQEDFAAVCKNMMAEWSNDPKMSAYLRPETLFGNKMDGYLNRTPKTSLIEEWR